MGRSFRERWGEAGRLDFDAEHFLGALYHGQPEGTLIAVGELARPHFCLSPADALPWVVGKQDVYTRITLLGERPKTGRGAAADSAALPGVWAEVDINGGPSSTGGVVENGAPDLDTALALCHSVLQPTLTVRSGYGVHAYWLFEAPWDIQNPGERERAGELVAGWQRRLKQAAAELGFELDSTFDLARVFRPAGTFNGKGDELVPVTLLDDGGPRYTIEQIDAEAIAPVVPLVPTAEPGHGRKPDDLAGRYPVLGRIARREGTPPKGGSESDWDFYLACEARRRVKPPIGREEAIELVAYGRRHGPDPKRKGDRGDYLERTVDKAFETVEAPEAPAAAGADPAAVINAAWRITAADPVVEGWSVGNGLAARVFLRRESGVVIRLRKLGDLFTATRHVAQVSVALRISIPDLSKPSAVRVAQAIIELCSVYDATEGDRREVEAWLDYFLAGLGTLVPLAYPFVEPGENRWRALVEQRAYKPDASVHGVAASTAGIRDGDGRIWIQAAPLARHIRQVERVSIEWEELGTRLTELGWEELHIDQHSPGAGRSKKGADHIRRVFYGSPPE